jgi:hypothetical protein
MLLPYSNSYFYFTKFLPDGGKDSFFSYVNQTIDKLCEISWAPRDKKSLINKLNQTSRLKSELYKQYIDNPSEIQNLLKSGIWPYPSYTFWDYHSLGANESEIASSFTLSAYLNKIPRIRGRLQPPLTERNRYKDLMNQALEKEIADIIVISDFTKKQTILGQANWVYLQEKINQIERLSWVQTQDRSQGASSIVYEFSQQLGEVLLPINFQIKIKRLDYLNLSDLTHAEVEKLQIAEEKIIQEFFKKYDDILLDAWGKKQFADNLVPLGVPLEEWLKTSVG